MLELLEERTSLNEQQIVSLVKLMKDNNDNENAEKLVDIYDKLARNEFIISFAGHFSAGKSSMINRLMGKEVLPNSPIPTSANIVKITSGEGVARVFFRDETPIEYDEPYDIDMIKDYCKDKDTIKRIEISTADEILPKGTSLIDTPGIDAADDADRLMTESSLHLVDLMYYVMDYNHVQSEVNLYFLRQLHEKDIPFSIIVNQVDKHNEAELSFSEFHNSILKTFDQWNISPKHIYYSSLIDDSCAHNQIQTIEADLFAVLRERKQSEQRINSVVKQIIHSHEMFLKDELTENTGDTSHDFSENDSIRLEELQNKIAQLEQLSEHLNNEYIELINTTLNNAYLMPATLRDQAKGFLESQQSDFKVGFFGAKKKTAEERERRLTQFLKSLQENINATVQWGLRDKILQFLKENDLQKESIVNQAQNLELQYTAAELLALVSKGAKINGNYILNYTNQVSNDIKTKYKNKALQLWEEILALITEDVDEKMSTYRKQLEQLQKAYEAQQAYDSEQQQLSDKIKQINETIQQPTPDQTAWNLVHEMINKNKTFIKQEAPIIQKETSVAVEAKEQTVQPEDRTNTKEVVLEDVIRSIENVTQTVNDLPGFNELLQDLQTKKSRLKNRTLTIALFGAFSAGKSSFSNALFGERILPVSPNPTTAVINRISPVTDKNKHGTVVISLKNSDQLANDVQIIMKDFSPKDKDFIKLISWIKENDLSKHSELDKMYQSYLDAMIAGFEHARPNLGQQVTISLNEFAEYVTDESKACYIDSVDLYYDCPLTRKGITLVDTPGADSVNARHTNVAFDYIKYADAILYVTYYNHALSRADKDFLMQLGRVKESFELDKMFFIINASDLAQSDSELKLVVDYVEDQLLQLGIRFPKIFTVSSKRSLEDKLNGEPLNKEMEAFEHSFNHFINHDLVLLQTQSAIWDIKRVQQTLQNYIDTAQLDAQDKIAYRQSLQTMKQQLKQLVDTIDYSITEERIIERIHRQLHYVEERLYIRFHDMFTEHFNPTTITETGRKARNQLERNRNHLLDYVGYELLQEVRAVSLRVESYIKQLLGDRQEQLQNDLQQIDQKFLLATYSVAEIDTPKYEQAFTTLNTHKFDKVLNLFNGTKAFFEKNEREQMKEAFYEQLKPEIEKYLQEHQKMMEESYQSIVNKLLTSLQEHGRKEIDSYINNNLQIIEETIDLNILEEKAKQLQTILNLITKDDVN